MMFVRNDNGLGSDWVLYSDPTRKFEPVTQTGPIIKRIFLDPNPPHRLHRPVQPLLPPIQKPNPNIKK